MSHQKLPQQMIGMTLVLLLLVGCDALASTPVPPTATPPQNSLRLTTTPGLPLAGTRPADLTPSPTVSEPTDIRPTPSGPNPTHPAEPTPAGLFLPPGVAPYPGAFYFFHGGALLAFASDDPPAMVMRFYEEKLSAGGWTFVNTEATEPDYISQNWQRGNRHLHVMIHKGYTENDFGSYIILTWPSQ